jgi:mono/diheme cytochrome c family protein
MQAKLSALVVAAALAGAFAAGCSKPADSSSSSADASASATPAAAASVASDGATSAASPVTVAAVGDPSKGAAIFSANCAGCHGVAGAGGGVGPSLKGEKSRKDTAAAIAWIKNPQAPMPKLYPSPLSERDVADVAAYVETL